MTRFLAHPYVMLALVALMWGGNAVAGKLAVDHISPMLLTFLRWLLSSALLLPFAWPRVRQDWPALRPKLAFLLALGTVGFTLFNALMYVALHYTSAINVMIEQSSMPLMVFLGSFILFRTRVTLFQILGFLLTAIGVLVTAAHGDMRSILSLDLNAGDAIMLLAVLLYGIYTVVVRYKPPIHWLSLIFVLACGALISSVPLVAFEWQAGLVQGPDALGLAVVFYAAVFASIISQTLYIKGIEAIGANRANLFINLVPIFGAVLAVLFVDEALYLYHVVALAFVLGGIALAERGKGQPALAVPEPAPTRR